MAKITAVFLGAGASKALGYPLTNEILPRIRQRLDSAKLFGRSGKSKAAENKAAEKELKACLRKMFPGWGKPDIPEPPITDVLSLIDYSSLSQTAPLLNKQNEQLPRFRKLLERAIYQVIDDEYWGKPTACLHKLVRYLMSTERKVGIITTNYDIEVETGIFKKLTYKEIETGIDFGFEWREPELARARIYPRPAAPRIRVYKLHGSLNWLRCDTCEHTYINVDGPIGELAFDDRRRLYNECHCGHSTLSLVLTAPSLIRDVRNPDLLATWKASVEWLRLASEWVIIGYSFPQEDLAIRSMFIRAYQARGEKQRPRVTVVQHGCDKATEARYRILFPECKWISSGLEGFLRLAEPI